MNDKQEAKFQELTGQPVGHLVCKMAAPTIISMMVTACYNMVDTYFVGQLHSNSATGAVGVVFSLMAVIQAVGFFFGHGSGNYISRQLCRKAKTMGFLMRCALSSFSFLCTEEIFSISSNLIIQLFFLPSAVKVAFTSAVPFRLTYQSKVVSEVGVTI